MAGAGSIRIDFDNAVGAAVGDPDPVRNRVMDGIVAGHQILEIQLVPFRRAEVLDRVDIVECRRGLEDERVGATAAIEGVGSIASMENVVPRASKQVVVAGQRRRGLSARSARSDVCCELAVETERPSFWGWMADRIGRQCRPAGCAPES